MSGITYNVAVTERLDVVAIGERLRELRAARKWSLRNASLRSGVSHTHIKDMESASIPNVSLDKLGKLADAYGVSLAQILGDGIDQVAPPLAGVRGDRAEELEGVEVNLLAIRELNKGEYEALLQEIARRKALLESLFDDRRDRVARRRRPKTSKQAEETHRSEGDASG